MNKLIMTLACLTSGLNVGIYAKNMFAGLAVATGLLAICVALTTRRESD